MKKTMKKVAKKAVKKVAKKMSKKMKEYHEWSKKNDNVSTRSYKCFSKGRLQQKGWCNREQKCS